MPIILGSMLGLLPWIPITYLWPVYLQSTGTYCYNIVL